MHVMCIYMCAVTNIFFSFNVPPYLFQIDFAHEIEPHETQVVLRPSSITFCFCKMEDKPWLKLQFEGRRRDVFARRMKSLEALEAKREELVKQAEKAKRELVKCTSFFTFIFIFVQH